MARAGDVIEGPDGFVVRLVRTGAETDGELLEMEAGYSGEGATPPAHLHPRQEETFHVMTGALQTTIGGTTRRYEAGDTFTVPPGTEHQMTADGPTHVRWEVRPALRTAEFFERLYGPGGPDRDLLAEFAEEIRLT